jgi:hypothetical protein
LAGDKAKYLGKVVNGKNINIRSGGNLLVNLTIDECISVWKNCDL